MDELATQITEALETRKFNLGRAVAGRLQMSILQREKPEELLTVISTQIESLNEDLNIKGKMSAEQVVSAAKFIITEYWYLKLPELFYFFRNIRKGTYGKIYERLDLNVINDFLNTYIKNERSEQLVINIQKKKEEELNHQDAYKILTGLKEKYPKSQMFQHVKAAPDSAGFRDNDYVKYKQNYLKNKKS